MLCHCGERMLLRERNERGDELYSCRNGHVVQTGGGFYARLEQFGPSNEWVQWEWQHNRRKQGEPL